jgi:hypothetical protein
MLAALNNRAADDVRRRSSRQRAGMQAAVPAIVLSPYPARRMNNL